MVEKPNAYKENRKAALTTIDQTAFNEMMIKQFNLMKQNGVELTPECEAMVSWYEWICEKFPEPSVSKPAPAEPKAEVKEKAVDSPPPAQAKAPKKKKTDK